MVARLSRRDVETAEVSLDDSGRAGGLPSRLAASAAVLAIAVVVGMAVGPARLPLGGVVQALIDRLPLVDVDSGLTVAQENILWKVRAPRVVLGGLVGAALAGGGAAYQGVFRNPLADPYLLGVAAGAGLGATAAIIYGPGQTAVLPVAAFAGGAMAVTLTYLVSSSVGRDRTVTSMVLAGVAVTSFLTAVQTYLQQQNVETVRQVYSWILGRLTVASWTDVAVVTPYVVVSSVVLLLHRRLLDVLRVGEDEASSLGVDTSRLRVVIVAAATLGTAAAVAVTGLIGFVGVIVPHTVRLMSNGSYRVVLPLSMVSGGAFLILADVLARSMDSPAEVPIGVITAFFGAPFFLVLLRSRRSQRAA